MSADADAVAAAPAASKGAHADLPDEPDRSEHEAWTPAWYGLTPEERAAVDALRQSLRDRDDRRGHGRAAEADGGAEPLALAEGVGADGEEDDMTLVRCLRARQLDQAQAERMVLDARRWRWGVRAHRILEEPPANKEPLFMVVPQRQHGYDRNGHPM